MKETQPSFKKFYSGYQGAGRDVYVESESHDTFVLIQKKYRNDYNMTSIMRRIFSLNADPLQSKGKNPAGDYRVCKSGNIAMRYCLYNGAVYITEMQISKTRVDQRFGLYPVGYSKKSKDYCGCPCN